MKRVILFLVFFAAAASVSFGQAPPKKLYTQKVYQKIESNYLKGLNSENPSLRVSCAYFLGEMKSEKALIPLMDLFHNTKNDGAKLVAAWSLLKIGNPRGVNLVKRAIETGECGTNIGCMLQYLYKDYCLETNGKADKS
jgi:hypothetical protein